MKKKLPEQAKALSLRKQGLSYREILEQVPVAKSTLSLWLREVGLSKKQKQRLTTKKLLAMRRGWEAVQKRRIERTKILQVEARKEVGSLSQRELWLAGILLYWAEGCKTKQSRPRAARLDFGNSDPDMIRLFLRWLREACNIADNDVDFSIYIHKNHMHRVEEVQDYWANQTGFPRGTFSKVYFKRHKIKTNRKNIGNSYYGLLRIRVKSSTDFARRVSGWIQGLTNNKNWGVAKW